VGGVKLFERFKIWIVYPWIRVIDIGEKKDIGKSRPCV
jgi:hypothetical protein